MKTSKAWIQLIRPLDWIKNIIVFAPLFFSPHLLNVYSLWIVLIGVAIFSVTASSIYILNDIRDRVSDRAHPKKVNRPLANETVSVNQAKLLCILFGFLGLACAFFFRLDFFFVILAYYLLNIAYCFALKHIPIVDVYVIAVGFTLRIIGGSVLIHVAPSEWILACTFLLALFLALAKRRDDLVQKLNEAHRKSIGGYNLIFVDVCITIVLSALFVAYLIYTTLASTAAHLGTEHFIYTGVFVLFGILRYLQITLVEERSGSPTQLIYRDFALICAVLLWVLVSTLLIYGKPFGLL